MVHFSSCGSHPLTRKRSVGKPNAQIVATCSGKTVHSVVHKMSIGLHEVCQATRQSLFQRFEKLLPKKTHTAQFYFLVDRTSSFRQLFVTRRGCARHPALKHGSTQWECRPSIFNKNFVLPCWTKETSPFRVHHHTWCCTLKS